MAKKDKSKKKLQDDLKESANRIWLAGLGALRVAEEEGSKLFNTLVEEGQRFSERSGQEAGKAASRAREAGEKARSEMKEGWSRVEQGFDRAVADTLGAMGVPSRSEIESLSRRIEELTVAVEGLRMRQQSAAGSAGTPSGKSAAGAKAEAAGTSRKTAKKPAAAKKSTTGPEKAKKSTKKPATKKPTVKKAAAKKSAAKKTPPKKSEGSGAAGS